MNDRNIKRYVWRAAQLLFFGFACLSVYILYLQSIQADELATHPSNRRAMAAESDIVRGRILDASNQILAYTDERGSRIYPMKDMMAPITGYMGETIGSAGIEGSENQKLLGLTEHTSRLGPIRQLLVSDHGNDVKLTLHAGLQKTAYDALGKRRGAIVVLDARTGAVIAMVSRPSFDPNHAEENWTSLNQQQDSPLLNRASQGLYPPGSTLKVMIAEAALQEKTTDFKEVFHCTGKLDLGGGYVLQESHGAVHGSVNLEQALAESCNITFATLAMRMGAKSLDKTFERYGFHRAIEGDVLESMPHLPKFAQLGTGDIAQVGIGQSELLVSPLRMAMLASAFANQGVIMKPYLLDEVISPNGVIIEKGQQHKWLQVTSPEQALQIDQLMEKVVTEGTGRAAQVQGVRVTGKTGTAENPGGADHAWFIGNADIRGRMYSFAVLVENSGGGGTEAAPIARRIITDLLDE